MKKLFFQFGGLLKNVQNLFKNNESEKNIKKLKLIQSQVGVVFRNQIGGLKYPNLNFSSIFDLDQNLKITASGTGKTGNFQKRVKLIRKKIMSSYF